MTKYPYLNVSPKWDKRYITPADLGPHLTMSEFGRKFRSDNPRLLVYDLRQVGWRGFVACAPCNTALAALDVSARILAPALVRWGEKVVNDLLTYRRFESLIREAKIKKEDVPKTLFWPYAGFGAYVKGTKRSFGTKSPLLDHLRVSGWVIPAERSAAFEQLLDEIILDASEWMFCRTEEESRITPNEQNSQSEVARLLGAPLAIDNEDASKRMSRLKGLSSDLSMAVTDLSVRIQGEVDAPYCEIVRPRVDLFANASGFGREASFDDLTEEVILRRIELSQGLRWPTFYSTLLDSLTCFGTRAQFATRRYDDVRNALRNALASLRLKHSWVWKVERFANDGF